MTLWASQTAGTYNILAAGIYIYHNNDGRESILMIHKADRLYRLVFTALALYLVCLLLKYPALSLEYASTGLMLWLKKMVPTLLPFMILSGIMIRMELTEGFVSLLHPFLYRLYGTSKTALTR